MLVDIVTNNTQYTTKCTNLHPTPASGDPLAKVNCLLYIVLIISLITLKSPLGLPPKNNSTKPFIGFRDLIAELQVYAQYSIEMRVKQQDSMLTVSHKYLSFSFLFQRYR